MGGSSSNSNTNSLSSQYTTTSPWTVQQPYIQNAFNYAQNAYDNSTAQGPYSGDYVAAPNQTQYDAYNQAANYAGGTGQNVVANQYNQGSSLMPQGFGGATGALSGLGNFANTDQTGNIINTAGQYANNPYINQAVNGAMTNAMQTASEQTLPNLYSSAAANGNLNSDRTALAQGVVDRGLAQTAAGLYGNMAQSNYQSGIGNALNQNAQQLQALSQEGSLGSNLGTTGSNLQSTSLNNEGALSNIYQAAGSGQQGLAQSILNNNMQEYQGNQNFPWQQLQNYYNVIGNKSWGSQGTSVGTSMSDTTTQQNPSPMSTIGSIMGGVGSFLPGGGMFNGLFGSSGLLNSSSNNFLGNLFR